MPELFWPKSKITALRVIKSLYPCSSVLSKNFASSTISELNKPKRGNKKKFYVYVKDPSSGNIKKVSFGDTTGLSVKFKDPTKRKAFADRHNCSTKKDRTKAGYWSCNLPRYAKQLGMGDNQNTYW